MEPLPIAQPRQAGIYVRHLREDRKESRASLAERAGVSERLLASLELGDATGIRLDKLLCILNALDMKLLVQPPDASPLARDGAAGQARQPSRKRGAHKEGLPRPQTYADAYRSFLEEQGIELEDIPHATH